MSERPIAENDAGLRALVASTLAQHQRMTSRPGGPCWCGNWPRDDIRRDTWMDHVADALMPVITPPGSSAQPDEGEIG